MKRMTMAASALTAVFFGLFGLFAREAHAFERQHHLGFGGGLGLLKAENASLAAGAGGSIHYAYGFRDNLNLVGELGTSYTRSHFTSSASVGVTYSFDVIQWVPYVGVLAGGYLLDGDGVDPVGAAGAQVALGLDYQVSRSFALGVALRQHFILTKLSSYPSYTTAFLRAEYVWGW